MKKTLLSVCTVLCLTTFLSGQTILVNPYLQDAEPTSIKVSWEADSQFPGKLEWGTQAGALTQTLTANSISTADGDYLYTATLTGLQPATRYYYRVGVGSTFSPTYDFISPPLPSSEHAFNIVAMSDMQKDGSHPLKLQEVVHDGILDYFESQHLEDDIAKHLGLVMIPGDLVVNGNNHGQWQNDFFAQSNPLFAHVPVYPVLGNHENNSSFYFQYFSLPENGTPGFIEHWWYKDYSNVRIIGLNSNGGFRIQEQLDWLDGVLDDACQDANIDFVFAQLHHPFKSELWTPGELNYTGDVISQLESFSTDCGKPSIHFFGHTHGYSRGQSRDHNHLWVNAATAGGAIDNWGEFPNQDYEEFSKSIDEYGFVVLNVEAGNNPKFVLRRITRGDQDVVNDNEQQDVITIWKNDTAPQTPSGLFPTGSGINPDCFVMQASGFTDGGDFHQASHWQLSSDCSDFTNPLIDSWKQHENHYFGIDMQAGDDLTNEEGGGLIENTNYCWRVRYRDEHLQWSEWSVPQSFSTGSSMLSNNLLLNPGAENGVSNWTASTGIIESLADGECNGEAPNSGGFYFAVGGLCDGNETAFSEAQQGIDVAAFAQQIDAGAAVASFGGYLSNFNGTDQPAMRLEFLNAAATNLGSSEVLTTTNDPWTLVENETAIPVATRSIRVVLTGTRNGGTDNDSYFDDLFLRVGEGGTPDCSTTALPVEILFFEANCNKRFNALSWQVTGESDILAYELERSSDSRAWETIGSVLPTAANAAIKSYEYRDFEAARSRQQYYRIKVSELDGSFHYSAIRTNQCKENTPSITLYPNPVLGDHFKLDIRALQDASITIHITDLLGRTILHKEENIAEGQNSFELSCDELSAGYYMLVVSSRNWQWTHKIVKH